ncbi:MAG: BamA/OMP85 family outer membrane protein [Pirellulaceae bacterium]
MKKQLRFLAVPGVCLLLAGLCGCMATSTPGRSSQSLFETVRFQDQADPENMRPDPVALTPSATPDSSADPNLSAATGQPVVNQAQIVKQVLITGNDKLPEHQILRHVRTRPGRYFDPDLLQQDVNQLWKMREVRRVNGPYIDRQADGIVVTIDVSERLYMDRVRYIGNRAVTDRQLATETGLSDGQPLDLHAVKMAKTRIEDLYEEKGYPKTEVSIIEGDEFSDSEVVFLIHEDHQQRVGWVTFEGNEIASDGRLRSFIKMKPGILWYFGGTVKRRELEQDLLRLESYYRSLGFFNARVGRELVESNDGRWLSVRYIINEGPRYRVRNVSFIGNEQYSSTDLDSVVKLKPATGESPEFNAARMNEDVTRLQDLYGSQGYVFAKVQAEPRFLEEPGLLDLVYNISEGEQYRVGKINVVIDGEYGVTRRQVVLNRMGLRPGDLLDTRRLREAEARLVRSQLFADGSPNSPGNPPRVVVKPPELDAIESQNLRR